MIRLFIYARRRPYLGTAALAFALLAVYLAFGIRYALYAPVASDHYLWAAYHVHSTMSDGLASPAEIARQARVARTSLVILTDHGNPNLAASRIRMRVDGVTIVGGSEVKLPEGRLTFFGASEAPRFALTSRPPRAMEEARVWGAFPVVSYTDDPLYGWHYWEPDLAPGGIEVSNLFTCVRALSPLRRLMLALYYPFSPYYFLKGVSFPAASLARWDNLLAREKTWGILASDAHGGFHLGKWFAAGVPSYAATFSLAGLGIDRKYEAQPEVAIRSGDFFNCVRGAAEPSLFDFYAERAGRKFSSGSSVAEGADIHVVVQASGEKFRIVVLRDGGVAQQVDDDHIHISNAPAGVYRVDIFLLRHPLLPEDVPWIVSNPIFVGDRPYRRPYDTRPARPNTHDAEASSAGTTELGPAQITAVH